MQENCCKNSLKVVAAFFDPKGLVSRYPVHCSPTIGVFIPQSFPNQFLVQSGVRYLHSIVILCLKTTIAV